MQRAEIPRQGQNQGKYGRHEANIRSRSRWISYPRLVPLESVAWWVAAFVEPTYFTSLTSDYSNFLNRTRIEWGVRNSRALHYVQLQLPTIETSKHALLNANALLEAA